MKQACLLILLIALPFALQHSRAINVFILWYWFVVFLYQYTDIYISACLLIKNSPYIFALQLDSLP